MRKIISLICFLLPVLAFAAQPAVTPEVRSDAPDKYVVVKGDTLWGISGKFFKDPAKWPAIWGANKDTIKNPHWIYPGDVVLFDRVHGILRFGKGGGGDDSELGSVIKLSPKVREGVGKLDAIPSIPYDAISPFLTNPMIIEAGALNNAPKVIGSRDGRMVLSKNDIGFVIGLSKDKGTKRQIYRPGKEFVDPDTKEILGTEAIYLGSAEVLSFDQVSTIVITKSVQEITQGDRLVVNPDNTFFTFLPRAPAQNITARVISVYGGVSQAGKNTIITLNKGARDGLENGHVLALFRKGETLTEKNTIFGRKDEKFVLPDDRYGLIFVFSVFEKVSYALVMQTYLPVELLDNAKTP